MRELLQKFTKNNQKSGNYATRCFKTPLFSNSVRSFKPLRRRSGVQGIRDAAFPPVQFLINPDVLLKLKGFVNKSCFRKYIVDGYDMLSSEIAPYSDSHLDGVSKPLSERIKQGIAESRQRGVRMGRPRGGLAVGEVLKRHSDVVISIREGKSINETASLTGKSLSTVQKVKALARIHA